MDRKDERYQLALAVHYYAHIKLVMIKSWGAADLLTCMGAIDRFVVALYISETYHPPTINTQRLGYSLNYCPDIGDHYKVQAKRNTHPRRRTLKKRHHQPR